MEKILIIDFGSQFTHQIAGGFRDQGVYTEVVPWTNIPTIDESIKGIVLSGGNKSVYEKKAPHIGNTIYSKPILGICYGAQYLAKVFGGKVEKDSSEYTTTLLDIYLHHNVGLLKDIPLRSNVLMNHGDSITNLSKDCKVYASTNTLKNAVFKVIDKEIWGVQFHPEVEQTTFGKTLFKNFIDICRCKKNWTPKNFITQSINEIRDKVGNEKVVLGISGGVDSTVASVLLHKAIGKNLHCIFVDNGLLRKDEAKQVMSTYKDIGIPVTMVDAGNIFLNKLRNVQDPEKKRKIIGKIFIDVFDAKAKEIRDISFLSQGTIYPDIIESISVDGESSGIKSHHNVGGLPEKMNLKLIEPLRLLFKNEVRKFGTELGIPDSITKRHPFPGPGLAIRIVDCAVTKDNLRIVREADHIFMNKIKKFGLYDEISQAYAAYDSAYSVGQKGDARVHQPGIKLRAIKSSKFMTADVYYFKEEHLKEIVSSILNNVKGISRVFYDITPKPPGTIEQE